MKNGKPAGSGESNQSNNQIGGDAMKDDKPVGSGLFAIFLGLVLACAFFWSWWGDLKSISPECLLRLWLAFAALILIWWGAVRCASVIKDDSNWIKKCVVGQDTFNFVVAIVGATIAIFTLVVQAQEP